MFSLQPEHQSLQGLLSDAIVVLDGQLRLPDPVLDATYDMRDMSADLKLFRGAYLRH
jgi:hypothetical protein